MNVTAPLFEPITPGEARTWTPPPRRADIAPSRYDRIEGDGYPPRAFGAAPAIAALLQDAVVWDAFIAVAGLKSPPDLAITDFYPADRVSHLPNRTGHALHLFGEPVPFGQNAFVLRQRTTICFPQDLDPIGCSGMIFS